MNIFVSFILILVSIKFCPSAAIVVDTKLGKVKGNSMILDNGKHVDEFIGIRYAQPPVGELRFKKPIPVTAWNDIYDATHAKNSCMQVVELITPDGMRIKDMNEDCLFLNIWKPKDVQGKSKLPVMFWIHGGAFAVGSAFMPFYLMAFTLIYTLLH